MNSLDLRTSFDSALIEYRVEVKMRRVFLVMAACCFLASPAFAAGGAVDLYAAYGQVVDGENDLGLGIRLSLGGTHWMFDVAATGYKTVENTDIIEQNPTENDDIKYRAFDLGLRYLFYEGHKLRPYLGAGVTYASASATYLRLDAGMGLYGMVGMRYGRTPGIQFMAELMYRYTEIEARGTLIDEFDMKIGGLGLQVGMSFVF
jgi:hypothetical protein